MSTAAITLPGSTSLNNNPTFNAVKDQLVKESETQPAAAHQGKLQAFEGFLKKAGHVAGVVLKDIVKFAVPIASVAAVVDPQLAPLVKAFDQSVTLVQAAVISIQQKWVADGSAANEKKLADVLTIVEQPIIALFAQAGRSVDNGYVTNLITGVVAILNAQPGALLGV